MDSEIINKVRVIEGGELLLGIEGNEKPMYQYIYREAAGVYWDPALNGFKSKGLKDKSCSVWFSHIVSIVKSGLDVELQLSSKTSWENIPEKDKNEIIEKNTI